MMPTAPVLGRGVIFGAPPASPRAGGAAWLKGPGRFLPSAGGGRTAADWGFLWAASEPGVPGDASLSDSHNHPFSPKTGSRWRGGMWTKPRGDRGLGSSRSSVQRAPPQPGSRCPWPSSRVPTSMALSPSSRIARPWRMGRAPQRHLSASARQAAEPADAARFASSTQSGESLPHGSGFLGGPPATAPCCGFLHLQAQFTPSLRPGLSELSGCYTGAPDKGPRVPSPRDDRPQIMA